MSNRDFITAIFFRVRCSASSQYSCTCNRPAPELISTLHCRVSYSCSGFPGGQRNTSCGVVQILWTQCLRSYNMANDHSSFALAGWLAWRVALTQVQRRSPTGNQRNHASSYHRRSSLPAPALVIIRYFIIGTGPAARAELANACSSQRAGSHQVQGLCTIRY